MGYWEGFESDWKGYESDWEVYESDWDWDTGRDMSQTEMI